MPTDYRRAADFLKQALAGRGAADLERLRPRSDPPPPKVPGGSEVTAEAIDARWALDAMPQGARPELADARTLEQREAYARNIENFIGTVKVPVGLAGPLRVNGFHARGDYYVPLASTEATLVASYSRGAQLVTEAGGCAALLLGEGVSRAPGFAFETLAEAAHFAAWAAGNIEAFRREAQATTRYGSLLDMGITVEGNHVYLEFTYSTGDASGQNMVTIATEAVCRSIAERAPVRPKYWFVEANLSGDKKATTHSFMSVRGKEVSAEVVIPGDLLERRLHTTTAAMIDYWRMSALGGVMSGSIGVQGHYANGLAALFIACGQDAACVAEAAVGVTRFEPREDGSLYAAVTLPNLIVGTVGGGTRLPSQRACLEILGLAGSDCARAFAEVAASLALAGELSITAALAAGQFTEAHRRLARAADKGPDQPQMNADNADRRT
jgi:hydroxymethylglutaryl-CoA reductase (NADPH)